MKTWTKISNDTISHRDFTRDVAIRVDGDFSTSTGLDDYTTHLTHILNLVEDAISSKSTTGLCDLIDELRDASEVDRYDGGIMRRAAYELERLLVLNAMNSTNTPASHHSVGTPVTVDSDVFVDDVFIAEIRRREAQYLDIKKTQLLEDIENGSNTDG